jgi:hypothetical protein
VERGVTPVTTYAPETHRHPLRANPWLVAVIVLGATVVGLAAWVFVPRSEVRSPDQVLVDEVVAAINARDGDAIGRLFTRDAVAAWAPDSPMNIVGLENLKKAVEGGVSAETPVGEPMTLRDPPTGFTVPDAEVDQHYVVQLMLIHDDPFVVVFDVRGGKVATQMIFEPFEPWRLTGS